MKNKNSLYILIIIMSFVFLMPVANFVAKTLTSAQYYGVSVNQVFPSFSGVDGLKKPFSSDDLKGKMHLVFFGNTRCGSVCYPRVVLFKEIDNRIKKQAPWLEGKIEYNFFTIDPSNDTPEKLFQYFDNYVKGGRSVHVMDENFFSNVKTKLGVDFSYIGSGQYRHEDRLYLTNTKGEVLLSYAGVNILEEEIINDLIKVNQLEEQK